ncbi:MAG: OmpA family protein, partial [Myxococcales bacterium]|nr:OmpA family protein [Myxococcales bacterium]
KDTDGDGIVDRLDKCPTEKEVFNGVEDDDGCPDKGPELATFTAQAIEIKQKILFEFGKAAIKPQSFLLLATVAKIMTLHPDVTLIRIEGHTDSVGTRAVNLKLSRERAESVRRHLVEVNGVEPSRLVAAGLGPDRPLDSNATAAGRAKNRRVEFVIVDRAADRPPPKLP